MKNRIITIIVLIIFPLKSFANNPIVVNAPTINKQHSFLKTKNIAMCGYICITAPTYLLGNDAVEMLRLDLNMGLIIIQTTMAAYNACKCDDIPKKMIKIEIGENYEITVYYDNNTRMR